MLPLLNATKGARAAPRAGAGMLAHQAPALREAAERLVAAMVKSLQTMAGTVTTIEGTVATIAAEPAKDVLCAHPPESIAAAIECPAVGCKLLASLNGKLVHSIVELLCGGNGAEPAPATARAATSIDHQFSHIVFTLAAAAIQSDWAAHGFGAARATKIEGAIPADLLGARVGEVAVVRATMSAFGQHGTFRLVLPPAALDRFRPHAEADDAAPATDDPAWAALLRQEIGRAAVTLDAHLDAKPLSLAAIAALKPGQILALPSEARARVALVCDGRVLYRGTLGQDDDFYSLRIDETVTDLDADPAIAVHISRARTPETAQV